MAELRAPIKRALRDEGPDEVALQRMWAGVLRRGAGEPRRRVLLLMPVLALSCAALLLWLAPGRESGALRLADGAPWPAQRAAGARAERLQLSDGSQVELQAGAALALQENNGRRLRLHLLRGAARFAVKPGGPRRWIIDGGALEVEAAGTRLLLTHEVTRAAVRVEEGVALVRGAQVAGYEQRLSGGQALTIELAPAAPPDASRTAPEAAAPVVAEGASGWSPAAPPPSVPDAGDRQGPATPGAAADVRGPAEDWRRLAQRQRFELAFAALPQGLDPAASAEDLLLRADVARRAGHPKEALRPLAALVARFPEDRRAALAAFTLGRILADDQGSPRAAAARFAEARRLGLPLALHEDALLREAEAWDRAGDPEAARRAAREYEQRFKDGRLRPQFERWLTPP